MELTCPRCKKEFTVVYCDDCEEDAFAEALDNAFERSKHEHFLEYQKQWEETDQAFPSNLVCGCRDCERKWK